MGVEQEDQAGGGEENDYLHESIVPIAGVGCRERRVSPHDEALKSSTWRFIVAAMGTVFRGNPWMDWVRFVLFGVCTITAMTFGILEIHGFVDAYGRVRHDAVVPCLVTAPFLGALAVMFLVNAIGRSRPVIELYREGIVCRMTGESHDFRMGGRIGLLVRVLSGRGFRQFVYRMEWQTFAGATITGLPMMYRLHLHGVGVNQHGAVVNDLSLAQHEFGQPIKEVAARVNTAAESPDARAKLPSWPPVG